MKRSVKRRILVSVMSLLLMVSVAASVPAVKVLAESNHATSSAADHAHEGEYPVAEGAAEDSHKEESSAGHTVHFGVVFAMFAMVLVLGKIGNFVNRYGQPAVIGELLAGVALSAAGYFGWDFVRQTTENEVIAFIASFGALLLLFSIGLESKISEMKRVGLSALSVALIGVTVPFLLGTYVLAPIFFSDASATARIFLGASLVATSVGITASVFRSLNMLRTRAAQTVIGAAVIDDVLGLIVLAVVSALATGGTVTAASVAVIAAKSFGFLFGSLIIGTLVAKPLSKLFSKLYSGIAMKLTFAISFALIFGYIAELFGLEPIIGAFAAGLLLEEVHFHSFADPEIVHDLKALDFKAKKDKDAVVKLINKHRDTHLEDLIASISFIFVPVFFVYTGMQIDFGSLMQPRLYVIAIVISIFAIIGKMVAGIAAKGPRREKLLVGASMVPRGEVGLIFAATGKATGVLNDELFSVIVLVVIITTFVSPPLIKALSSPSTGRS